MTFDPESLYAKPEPGRGVRPAVFVAGGVALLAVVGGIVTTPYWWPGTTPQTAQGQEIKSNNPNTPRPPLNFSEHYKPAVCSPPADPKPTTDTPAPTPAATPSTPR